MISEGSKWKHKMLAELKAETSRLLARIEDAEKQGEYYSPDHKWAAVKRASMDVSRVGAKLRKGYLATKGTLHGC